jgi:hypothetical protein
VTKRVEMSEVSTAFMAERLSTKACKCNSFNLDRIFGNDRAFENKWKLLMVSETA